MTDRELADLLQQLDSRRKLQPRGPRFPYAMAWELTTDLLEARRLLRGWLNVGGNVGSDWYDMTKALLDESDGD